MKCSTFSKESFVFTAPKISESTTPVVTSIHSQTEVVYTTRWNVGKIIYFSLNWLSSVCLCDYSRRMEKGDQSNCIYTKGLHWPHNVQNWKCRRLFYIHKEFHCYRFAFDHSMDINILCGVLLSWHPYIKPTEIKFPFSISVVILYTLHWLGCPFFFGWRC